MPQSGCWVRSPARPALFRRSRGTGRALYGAGSLGRLARKFLTSVDRDFALVVDLNAELARDPYWSGVALKHPDAASQAEKHMFRLAVSIVNSPYVPIERSLRERGFEDVVPFYDLAESPCRASAVERLVRTADERRRPQEHRRGAGRLGR